MMILYIRCPFCEEYQPIGVLQTQDYSFSPHDFNGERCKGSYAMLLGKSPMTNLQRQEYLTGIRLFNHFHYKLPIDGIKRMRLDVDTDRVVLSYKAFVGETSFDFEVESARFARGLIENPSSDVWKHFRDVFSDLKHRAIYGLNKP